MVDSVCDLEKTKYLHIDIPVVYAGEDTTVCSGSIVSIGNTQTDTMNLYNWKWDGKSSIDLMYNEFPYYVLPYDTTHYILEATSLNNCKSRDTITVNTLPLPEISVEADAKKYGEDYLTIFKDYNPLVDTVINDSIMYDIYEIIKGQTVEISVIPDTNYEYSFYRIVNSQDEQNADTSLIYSGGNPIVETFVPTNLSSADIDVYVEDQNGCISKEYLSLLTVANLPNAFTPLTKDGKNDLFLKGVPVKILNRWGQTLFEGTEGWDGTFNGRNVSPGTYFYIVEIKDGERTYTMKGTVLVVEK
jgi:gliding motility-associated-like protein